MHSIYRNALIKSQILILNLNVSKTEWDGAEEPTINNFYTITALFYINESRQIYSLAISVLGGSYGPPAETHVKWKK